MSRQATCGFVGKNDPDKVLGAVLWRPAFYSQQFGHQPLQVWFQAAKNKDSTVVPTGFCGTVPVWMRIETSSGSSRLIIDDDVKAEISANIPIVGAPFDLQIWSDPMPGGGYWGTTTCVDCLSVGQDRQWKGRVSTAGGCRDCLQLIKA